LQLSGGEQQMLAFGRALVLNPKLLLLDEPLEGLAPIIVEELLRAIRRVARDEGLPSIVVEQHPHMVLGVTDDAIVLDRGGIAYRATSQALRDDPVTAGRVVGRDVQPTVVCLRGQLRPDHLGTDNGHPMSPWTGPSCLRQPCVSSHEPIVHTAPPACQPDHRSGDAAGARRRQHQRPFADRGPALAAAAPGSLLPVLRAPPWPQHPAGGCRVHVDDVRQQVTMYFHGPAVDRRAELTFVARSADGIHFQAGREPVASFYFRAVRWRRYWVGMSKGGTLYLSDDGGEHFRRLRRPAFPMNHPLANGPGDVRHVALKLDGDRLLVFHSRIGDTPECIRLAVIDLARPVAAWQAGASVVVLQPVNALGGCRPAGDGVGLRPLARPGARAARPCSLRCRRAVLPAVRHRGRVRDRDRTIQSRVPP
jgi:hypothetical protein